MRVGGMSGLAMAWVLGPRRGKYSREGVPSAFPGHNGVLVVFGCFLAWIGCIGLGCAGATLFNGSVGAGGGEYDALGVGRGVACGRGADALSFREDRRVADGQRVDRRTGGGERGVRRDASSGRGADRAGGGSACHLRDRVMELRLFVDDPGGAIAVHGVGGLWGVIAFGVIGGRWLPQFVGAATIVGFVLPPGLLA